MTAKKSESFDIHSGTTSGNWMSREDKSRGTRRLAPTNGKASKGVVDDAVLAEIASTTTPPG
jgi:hypothetical protein